MKKIEVVLSLFDGMSCGQLALKKSGVIYDKYYASEIDEHAIKVTKKNFPETVHLGSVVNVKASQCSWIDLVIGGSPCQGFSFAGKGLNFDDPRSKLFFEFVRILDEARSINPEVKFLLENVRMAKESENIISNILGVQPIKINSNLVSAQNRKRLYWTNIGENSIEQPKDKLVFLRDIIEHDFEPKYYLSEKLIAYILNKKRIHKKYTAVGGEKALTVSASFSKNGVGTFWKEKTKASCFTVAGNSGGAHSDMDLLPDENGKIRRLTPIEVERLQTVPDNYTNFVSDTQRYKMLGNGWTVDVIAHIFSYL